MVPFSKRKMFAFVTGMILLHTSLVIVDSATNHKFSQVFEFSFIEGFDKAE